MGAKSGFGAFASEVPEEQGIEQGIERGLEQGLVRTAQNLINEGMTNAFIVKVTGLSETTIERLRNNLH
ncbi:hypothetical protein FE784_24125 [Paenibacillus hemerocallicola]|uniref:Transposase n=1 Tax=Paenibacillus hemerocallicola TaxID=1172614 RepID=A0A5C4T3S3_9BACL|nr:hypothetical protein [Paenibacillus hemerocallicola]TNJ63681.1 hypothetical protein FE784_24125 [Paenibacillus hemerocallicola]